MKPIRRLLIVGRVIHYRHAGKLYAYTGYAREMDVWAELFPEVFIAGTLRQGPPPGDCSPLLRPNITVLPLTEAGGQGWRPRLRQALLLPRIIVQLLRALRQADAIHVRCPCDLGLLGVLLAPLFGRPLVAKYAAEWQPNGGETWSWWLQRALLKSRWWRGPVTVYGRPAGPPAKVVPFFTSVLQGADIERARAAAKRPRFSGPLRLLFVGRLSAPRNADVLLKAMAAVRVPNGQPTCTVVGEGPERPALERLAETLGIRDRVEFTGGLRLEDVFNQYEQADVLVLASDMEGWGKVIVEAMAFGLVCIGSERGVMPQMLAEGRGLVVPPKNVEALRAAIGQVASDPAEAACMARRAAAWAQRYSLEGLGEALRHVLTTHWGVSLPPIRSTALQSQELPA